MQFHRGSTDRKYRSRESRRTLGGIELKLKYPDIFLQYKKILLEIISSRFIKCLVMLDTRRVSTVNESMVVIALDTQLARIVNLQEPISAGASIIVPRGGSKVIISHRDNRRPLTIREISDKRATRVKEKKHQCVSCVCLCVCVSSRSSSGEICFAENVGRDCPK